MTLNIEERNIRVFGITGKVAGMVHAFSKAEIFRATTKNSVAMYQFYQIYETS